MKTESRTDGQERSWCGKIWIDLDNTPHVPFFIPIIRELQCRGYEVVLTARDAFQVCELADRSGMDYQKVGRHFGKNMALKLFGLVWRSMQLLPFALRVRPRLALSHGSRSQIFLANCLRIPSVMIMDYEHSQSPFFSRPRWEIVPDVLPDTGLQAVDSRVLRYPGIKEDVYASEFHPDPLLLDELGIDADSLIVTVRPPADEAHYHNPAGEVLFEDLMNHLVNTPGIRIILLPRNKHQEQKMRAAAPEWFEDAKTIVPARAVNGLNLLWYSDLVVSGGGTMNREAAALGLPVYSIFMGPTGAVDRMLEQEGRLVRIRTSREMKEKIVIKRRNKTRANNVQQRDTKKKIVDHLESIIKRTTKRM